jgi:Flp pilus assembly CpaE family ATPase
MNPELPSMKNARLWSELLAALEFTEAPVRTIVNKFDERAVVTKDQIEKNLQTEVDVIIPFDRDSTMSCINRGEMLIRFLPKSDISRAILGLADRVLNIQPKSAQAGEASFLSSWMGRIKNRFKITG